MGLIEQISEDIKSAMRAREKETLNALRGIKSALMLELTKGDGGEVGAEVELKIVQKLHKQRLESAELYESQERSDLAVVELEQAKIIERYLPEQMSDEDLNKSLQAIIDDLGASGPQDMGKVMGKATQLLAGKAPGKKISECVKKLLTGK